MMSESPGRKLDKTAAVIYEKPAVNHNSALKMATAVPYSLGAVLFFVDH
ncbi:MAG TPA: hypothetical protein VNB22_10530 [Pyrinomonadaceae bacterium]|jgi:hypothetical protein|nr:hypothetical protein [Pyrinomonadaceae bacterium]